MNLNEPAMPCELGIQVGGMTLRAYAAIHLCVPDSGNDELDAMIKRAQRERLATAAMSSILTCKEHDWTISDVAPYCYCYADAMIAAGESNEAK